MSRKLVLHIDINQTIAVCDSCLRLGPNEAINIFISGVVWGQERDKGNHTSRSGHSKDYEEITSGKDSWEWNSFQPSLEAPNTQSISYYKYLEARTPESNVFERSNFQEICERFTATPQGGPFRSLFNTLRSQVLWNYPLDVLNSEENYSDFVVSDSHGVKFHFLLPSFINLLYSLHQQGRDFSIIFRTYGNDSGKVLNCLEKVVQGLHPGFPTPLPLNVNTTPGFIRRHEPLSVEDTGLQVIFPPGTIQTDDNGFQGTDRQQFTYSSLEETKQLYRAFSGINGICAFQDDFIYWRQNGFSSATGKPFLIDHRDSSSHHIFFDDNARVGSHDNILDMRFLTADTSCNEVEHFSDAFVVRANLLESITDMNYFVDQVDLCEKAYTRIRNETP